MQKNEFIKTPYVKGERFFKKAKTQSLSVAYQGNRLLLTDEYFDLLEQLMLFQLKLINEQLNLDNRIIGVKFHEDKTYSKINMLGSGLDFHYGKAEDADYMIKLCDWFVELPHELKVGDSVRFLHSVYVPNSGLNAEFHRTMNHDTVVERDGELCFSTIEHFSIDHLMKTGMVAGIEYKCSAEANISAQDVADMVAFTNNIIDKANRV